MNYCKFSFFNSANSFCNTNSTIVQSTLWGDLSASASFSHAHNFFPRCCSISSQYNRPFWGFQNMWWYWHKHTMLRMSPNVCEWVRLFKCSACSGPEQLPSTIRKIHPPSRSMAVARKRACMRRFCTAALPIPATRSLERFKGFPRLLKPLPRLSVEFHPFILLYYTINWLPSSMGQALMVVETLLHSAGSAIGTLKFSDAL